MAESKRNKPSQKSWKAPQRLRYFYLNGKLHKTLHINRGLDIMTAWCYPDHERVQYVYTDVRKNYGRAWTTRQVMVLLNRSRERIEIALNNEEIPRPQHTYNLTSKKKYQYLWSDEDVKNAHNYFASLHHGRPRLDGGITPWAIPSARELRAHLRNETVLYVKTEDGFIPTWEAEQF